MQRNQPGPRFDVRDIPFSHRGAWIALSPVTGVHIRSDEVHLVSHIQGMNPILRLCPLAPGGEPVRARVEATAAVLRWSAGAGGIEAAFETTDTVRLRGRGLGLMLEVAVPELTSFTGPYLYRDPVDGAVVVTSYETGRRYRITVIDGVASVSGSQALGVASRAVVLSAITDTGYWDIAIEQYAAARTPYVRTLTFEQVAARAAEAFTGFLDRIAPWRTERTPGAELAAYVLWSATVDPAGFVSRPAVLMSKHWMNRVWSWDHCFNALALAQGEPRLAWDQFQLPFDHQDAAGALPDSVTQNEVLYNYVKPPIHGWTLDRLGSYPASSGEKAALYTQLERWTEYWLSRRAPGSPLPHYHHGNDSGWDNATTFDAARLMESPDLPAFLVLQMRHLAALATELGREQEAARWAERADTLLGGLIRLLWTGDRFAAREAETGALRTTDSLLEIMPIVLGELLPAHIHTRLAEKVAQHLTAYGPATEQPGSAKYTADGYWRGPIWAPSTLLIEDGLRRAGHTALADEISARFRALCERSGFAENFDALTGQGLRDRAYTWTASAYLILAERASAAEPVTPHGGADHAEAAAVPCA